MIYKRNKFYKKQLLLKIKFLKKEIYYLIYKSFFKNMLIKPIIRLSFTINIFFFNKIDFFKSLQKNVCPFTLCKKVPSKSFLFSRFYLNHQFNTLRIANTLK